VLPHLHTREDEYSTVVEGQVEFRSGDREVVLGAGGYITKPAMSCTRCGMPAMYRLG
jgi:uncharacterized cupin superfamily protein